MHASLEDSGTLAINLKVKASKESARKQGLNGGPEPGYGQQSVLSRGARGSLSGNAIQCAAVQHNFPW